MQHVNLESRVSVIENDMGTLKRQVGQIFTMVEDIKNAQGESNKPQWLLWVAVLSLIVLIGGPILYATVEPLRVQLSADKEIAVLQMSINKLELEKLDTANQIRLSEVETQFRANDETRNVQWAHQFRTDQMLQNSLSDLGGKLPRTGDAPYYFPHIEQDGK